LSAVVIVGGGLGLYFGLRSSDSGPVQPVDVIPPGQYGAVASNGAECAQMAVDVLKEGGSAADAAITTLFCEGVAVAQSMGLGGGFLMTIYEKETGKIDTIVARETAPNRATADMFIGNTQAATIGGLAVAVPAELKGYWEVHQKYGKLPWRRLIEPSIQLCLDGPVVTSYVAGILRSRNARIFAEPTLREILIDPTTNMTWVAGDRIRRPKLAETLQIIALEGADAIYSVNGTLLKPLVEDIQALGGIITENDILNF
jgi:gamma-glutamyltranspeptidase / glutathione hydrolase / leukotriene-C4 hydrolase